MWASGELPQRRAEPLWPDKLQPDLMSQRVTAWQLRWEKVRCQSRLEAAAKPCSVPKAANRTAQALCQERNLISLLTNETKMWLEVPCFGGMSNFPIINHPNQIVFISLHYLAAFLWQTIWVGFCFSPIPITDVICGLWQRDAGVKRGWTGHLYSKNLAKTMSVIIS